MNKNTFYAIFLSLIIIAGSLYVQTKFFPPTPVSENTVAQPVAEAFFAQPIDDESVPQQQKQQVVLHTDVFKATLSNKNGALTSLVRKRVINGEEQFVELIPQTGYRDAFRVLLANEFALSTKVSGAPNEDALQDVFFNISKPNAGTVVFTKDFVTKDNQSFTLKKTYTFKNDEDIFQLAVEITNKQNAVLNLGDSAYTLTFGPQLGPENEITANQKNNRTGRRWFIGLLGNKLKTIRLKNNRISVKDDQYKWSGISGRYFSLLVLTNTAKYTTTFSTHPEPTLASGGQLAYTRAPIQSSAIEDVFRIYAGPGSGPRLARYNNSQDNAFNLANAEFNKIKQRRLLSFLERFFAWVLNSIYTIIPNYGVAIIILTLLVRFLTLPVLRKSKKNSEKMKALGPKMQQIKERFPDDRARQSQEMMELYKRENFSPFSSFLPMLIQIPFFLAMYRVIYENFNLWRQPFAGWISDLSEPDMLMSFGDFTIPVIHWTGLNILPIIMLGTQFFSSLILTKQQSQTGAAGPNKGMMIVLSYGFPFIIFFALYNSPSGLILYWIISNIFTVFSMMDCKKPAAEVVASAEHNAKKSASKTQPDKKKKTFAQRMQAYINQQNAMAKHRRK